MIMFFNFEKKNTTTAVWSIHPGNHEIVNNK